MTKKNGYQKLLQEIADHFGTTQAEQAQAMGLTQPKLSQKLSGKVSLTKFERFLILHLAASFFGSTDEKTRAIKSRARVFEELMG